jgi:rhamnosyltransferase
MAFSRRQNKMISHHASAQEETSQDCRAGDGSLVSPSMATICGVIVTYRPDSEFFSRAQRLSRQLAKVVAVDNGSSESSVGELRELADKENLHLILNHRNEGVARALNQGAEWATAHGFDWILTLDQDTLVEHDMVESLCAVYHTFPDQTKLAMIGSNYTDSVLRTPFLTANGDNDRSWLEVKTTITSGSLIPLSAYSIIGPFREELFIDCVDFEYCLRARSMGFRVIMTRKPLMQHGIGNVTMHDLPWKTTTTSNHSPARRYFMTRNQLVLAREYLWSEPIWTAAMLYTHLKATILMFFFEKDVLHKLRFTGMGVWDGLLSNFKRNLG